MPAVSIVITPSVEPIVAIAVLPLRQRPPVDVLVSVDVVPTQMLVTPAIVAGKGLTATVSVT